MAMSLPRVASVRSACVGTDLPYQGFTNRQLVCNTHDMTTTPPTTKKDADTTSATTVLERKTATVDGERIAYVDAGDGGAPTALFVHGVLVNADLWRNVIFDVADLRRCIAPDLPAHGASPVPGADGRRFADGSGPHAQRAVRASWVSTGSTSWPTTPAAPSPRCSPPTTRSGSAPLP